MMGITSYEFLRFFIVKRCKGPAVSFSFVLLGLLLATFPTFGTHPEPDPTPFKIEAISPALIGSSYGRIIEKTGHVRLIQTILSSIHLERGDKFIFEPAFGGRNFRIHTSGKYRSRTDGKLEKRAGGGWVLIDENGKLLKIPPAVRKMRNDYDQIAPFYTKRWQETILPEVEKQLRRFMELIPPGPVLDAGTGPGQKADWIQRHEPERGIIGVDLSRTMLEFARQRFPNLHLSQASVHQLPFATDILAGVWDDGVFQHIPRDMQGDVLGEYRRVLQKNGGILAILLKKGKGSMEKEHADSGVSRHFELYEETSLRRLVTRHGFTVLESGIQYSSAEKTTPDKEWVYLFATPSIKGSGTTKRGKHFVHQAA